MHTVFLRLHNKMGGELYDLNRRLTGDEIYYTVRKIIGAIMQKITYNDWLPTILGMIIFCNFVINFIKVKMAWKNSELMMAIDLM